MRKFIVALVLSILLNGGTEALSLPTVTNITFVPRIVPVGGKSSIIQVTPTIRPTSTLPDDQQGFAPHTPSGPPLALTLVLLGICCIVLLLLGVFILGFIARSQDHRGGKNG